MADIYDDIIIGQIEAATPSRNTTCAAQLEPLLPHAHTGLEAPAAAARVAISLHDAMKLGAHITSDAC